MNIEKRKIELINWITELESELLIESLEQLRMEDESKKTPSEIIQLLQISKQTSQSELVKHSTSKEIFNKK